MRTRASLAAMAVVVFVLGASAWAQSVPQQINYQGRLTDSTGQPVNNLSVPMVFGVWDAGTVGAGSQLWTEAQLVPVVNGLYSVRLGAVTPVPASVFGAPARYLQVSVFGETLSPRAVLTSVPYALNADLLDGQHATSFAAATHGHAFSEITGAVTDAQIPDNITITNADKVDNLDASAFALAAHNHSGANITSGTIGSAYFTAYGDLTAEGYLNNDAGTDLVTRDQGDARFAPLSHNHSGANITSGTIGNAYFSAYSDLGAEGFLNGDSSTDLILLSQGDTRFVNTTGDDSMAGSLTIGGDLRVTGANIGLNIAPNSTYGITNNPTGAPGYGMYLYGSSYAIRGMYASDPATHYTWLSSADTGIYATTGSATDTGIHYGGRFISLTTGSAYGLKSEATGYGAGNAYAVFGQAANASTGNVYGGYFQVTAGGSGTHYGLWASSDGWAGWFQDGKVHIGSAGTENYVLGNGDLYVQNALEVDGIAHFTGGIDAPNGIDAADINFNYAGSASEGGPASDLACTSCVSSAEINAANLSADQLDGQHGSYYQSATNINAGTLGNGYFSAYSDLTAEGYLDGGTGADLVTRTQGDTRFLNADRDDATTGSLTVGGDLQVTGANIGLGTAPNALYGIINDPAAAPTHGAQFYGTTDGVLGRLASDPTNHYGYLGSLSYGAYARAGANDETSIRYGGVFYGYSQSSAYGSYGLAYGYGAGTAYGAKGLAYGESVGTSYGGYFTVSGSGSGAKYAGYFGGGRVKIGDAGTQNYVNGDGDLFVEDQLEVGGAINYSTPRLRYYSIPMVGESYMEAGGWHRYNPATAWSQIFCDNSCTHRFPVHLPDDAIVGQFVLWGYAEAAHDLTCRLLRGDDTGHATQMARLESTTTNMNPLSTTTISNETIDNQLYCYFIECWEAAANGNYVELYRMRIDYLVNGPE
jgi:hypothetical protein